jgi:zinc D-Ala-D-Ala dipeptidase
VNRYAMFLLIASAVTTQGMAQKRANPQKKTPPTRETLVSVPQPYRDSLDKSQQAAVVTTSGWDAVDGELIRFEKQDGKWTQVGDKIPVVVGKNGLAWDGTMELQSTRTDPVKREGDGRSPAGIFTLSQIFGFQTAAPDLKMAYLPLTEYSECVDDPNSQSYNKLVNRQQMPNPDWNSSEKMRTIDQYRLGVVVGYNDMAVPGSGSCIFLHIWNGTGKGTAGCTAMDESKLSDLAQWLDSTKYPVLIQFPAPVYQHLRGSWQLP